MKIKTTGSLCSLVLVILLTIPFIPTVMTTASAAEYNWKIQSVCPNCFTLELLCHIHKTLYLSHHFNQAIQRDLF